MNFDFLEFQDLNVNIPNDKFSTVNLFKLIHRTKITPIASFCFKILSHQKFLLGVTRP